MEGETETTEPQAILTLTGSTVTAKWKSGEIQIEMF